MQDTSGGSCCQKHTLKGGIVFHGEETHWTHAVAATTASINFMGGIVFDKQDRFPWEETFLTPLVSADASINFTVG